MDASDPVRDDEVLKEVEEIERRRIMARVERMKRKIPTPSGKARAAKLVRADAIVPMPCQCNEALVRVFLFRITPIFVAFWPACTSVRLPLTRFLGTPVTLHSLRT